MKPLILVKKIDIYNHQSLKYMTDVSDKYLDLKYMLRLIFVLKI